MSFIFIVVLRTRKRLTPKDVAAVKGLNTLTFVRFNNSYYLPMAYSNILYSTQINYKAISIDDFDCASWLVKMCLILLMLLVLLAVFSLTLWTEANRLWCYEITAAKV
jgi:hypothetical protein